MGGAPRTSVVVAICAVTVYHPGHIVPLERVGIKRSVAADKRRVCWQISGVIGQRRPSRIPVLHGVSLPVGTGHRHSANVLVGSFEVHNSGMPRGAAIEAHIHHVVSAGVSECGAKMPVRVAIS